jgi:26S proteasome non-ATPase regulatory subunit 9
LREGDEIRNFGYVNNTNHDGLRRVGECVQGNEGVSYSQYSWFEAEANSPQRDVLVKISRPPNGGQQRQELQLTLTPRRNWGGRGLLGCHILPL